MPATRQACSRGGVLDSTGLWKPASAQAGGEALSEHLSNVGLLRVRMVSGSGGSRKGMLRTLLLLLSFPLLALLAAAEEPIPPPVTPFGSGDLAISEALFLGVPDNEVGGFTQGIYAFPGGPCAGCHLARFATPIEAQQAIGDALAVSPDGRFLAATERGSYVNIFRMDGTLAANLVANPAEGVAWLPDSSAALIAGSGNVRTVGVDGNLDTIVFELAGTDPFVFPDGRFLVSDGTGTQFFAADGSLGNASRPFPIPSALVAPDGSSFARTGPGGETIVESFDGTMSRILNPTPGRDLFAYDGNVVLFSYTHPTEGARWSMLRAADGFLLDPFGFQGTPLGAAFSPDGTRVAVLVDDIPPGAAEAVDSWLEVRELAGDRGGFRIPLAPGAFASLDWAPVEGPVRVWAGVGAFPAPPPGGEGRVGFRIETGDVLPRGFYSARPDGTDIRPVVDPEAFPFLRDLGPGPGVGNLAFTGGSGHLFAVPWDGSGPPTLVLERSVDSFDFSPSGNLFVVGVDDHEYGCQVYRRAGPGWEPIHTLIRSTEDCWFLRDNLLAYRRGGETRLFETVTGLDFPLAESFSGDPVFPTFSPSAIALNGDVLSQTFYGPGENPRRDPGRRLVLDRDDIIPLDVGPAGVLGEGTGMETSGRLWLVGFDGTRREIGFSFLDRAIFTADGNAVIATYDFGGVLPPGFAEIFPGFAIDSFVTLDHITRYIRVDGTGETYWPFLVPRDIFAFTTGMPEPRPVEEPLIDPVVLVAASSAPQITIGESTSDPVQGTVVYRSRFGRSSLIIVRDAQGVPAPTSRFGDAVVWDTTTADNGYYSVEATDSSGGVLESATYLVQNARSTPRNVAGVVAAGVVVTTTAAIAAGFSSAAKESALEAAESRLAGKAAHGLVGLTAKGAIIGSLGILAAGSLVGVAGTYEKSASPSFSADRFWAFLPYVGVALTLFFLAEVFIDRFYARHVNRETEFKLWLPGALSLGVSTALFGTPFGVPGHVAGSNIDDPRVDARRGLATVLTLFALTLPFVLLAKWKFAIYEVGITTAMMLAINLSIPVADLPGAHVWRWSKWAWGAMVLVAFGLFTASLLAIGQPTVFLAAAIVALVGLVALFAARRPGVGV